VKKFLHTYGKICLCAFAMQGVCMFFPFAAGAVSNIDTFALYVAPNTNLYINSNAQVSIFSDVINSGVFGTVKGVTVNLYGDNWRNTTTATFPDEFGINNNNSFTGVGGLFRFGNSNFPQYLAGGYSLLTKPGNAFTNLSVANPRGLYLSENTDAQIRGTLVFENGLLWLNGNNLVVGVLNPGAIAGYTENRFVATGNTSKGGYLYRSQISSSAGSVVFPVGTQAGSYAPVSVMFNTTTPQDIHVRVFDNIYRNAFQGTTGSPASVQQTWNLGQQNNTAVPSIIGIQHINQNEGAAFTAHRGNSYISMYDFTLRTWDTLGPSGVSTPGSLTTGTPQRGTYVNARIFTSLGLDTYLTKNADTRTDSITIAKAALTPVHEPDGSFRVTYLFLVHNASTLPVNTLAILDTLNKVFISPATFTVTSVAASGNLSPNPAFDGVVVTDLLLPASTLAPHATDSVTLVLNVVNNKKDGYYYNTASVNGILNGFNNTQYVVNNLSVNGLTFPAPGTASVPTPVILSQGKYQIPEGISPNGDGINDKFVIGSLGIDYASIWVFNKQGILVYKNLNYHNDWDGTSNLGGPLSNQKVEDGTYFYKIVVADATTGKQETYYGFLSIWK
jgi:gliding motility-associated-like protein